MKDMDKAVERVERAVRNREKIMVYGDYDAMARPPSRWFINFCAR